MNQILSLLTLGGQLLIIFLLLNILINWKRQTKIVKFIADNAISFAFIASLIATGGSLYYSQILKFNPCELCWFQRIFIYPQVILLGLACLKKEAHILDYSLSLIGIGTIISLYHNYIYYTAQTSTTCSLVTPCTTPYIVGLNYISIPLMSLTVLILMGLLLITKKISIRNSIKEKQ